MLAKIDFCFAYFYKLFHSTGSIPMKTFFLLSPDFKYKNDLIDRGQTSCLSRSKSAIKRKTVTNLLNNEPRANKCCLSSIPMSQLLSSALNDAKRSLEIVQAFFNQKYAPRRGRRTLFDPKGRKIHIACDHVAKMSACVDRQQSWVPGVRRENAGVGIGRDVCGPWKKNPYSHWIP